MGHQRRHPQHFLGKVMLAAVILVGLIWLLLFGGSVVDAANNGQSPEGEAKPSLVARTEPDLYYSSNRKVPKGPDPIHNRRAGNSGRPPGQA
ncbi:hypothetical protein SAY86_031221 [Trapa natans]|uniref:CLAVATA3/ESR (CLE)-related protein 25 n=1 Tax=Trapa natans TaxID=22666 RepID=A0AAN7M315_TRANT|nr:hypothetical protein SAY86_031221 [Trapa natans]